MRDPYSVLGLAPTASDEEVKAAYRALARKYHPDNFAGNAEEARRAEEKMKEINEAYDTIVKLRTQHTGGANGAANYAEIRRKINGGMFADAELMLGRIDPNDRGAEWHYLKSVVLMRRGWLNDALTEIEIACNLDPHNDEYRRARDAFVRNAAAYGGGYNRAGGGGRTSGECNSCDMCSGLILADCCCECMGGDFIRCI